MIDGLRDFFRHRALVGVLVSRELKARYRGSVLGFFWSLLNPLLMLTVYSIVFQFILPNRSESTRPYAVFLFCGLLPWNWFSSAVSDSAASLLTHGALLKKILFPAEVLPAVAVLSQGIHFVLALPILLAELVLGAEQAGARHVVVGAGLHLPGGPGRRTDRGAVAGGDRHEGAGTLRCDHRQRYDPLDADGRDAASAP